MAQEANLPHLSLGIPYRCWFVSQVKHSSLLIHRESSRARPKVLVLCTHVGGPEEASEFWLCTIWVVKTMDENFVSPFPWKPIFHKNSLYKLNKQTNKNQRITMESKIAILFFCQHILIRPLLPDTKNKLRHSTIKKKKTYSSWIFNATLANRI